MYTGISKVKNHTNVDPGSRVHACNSVYGIDTIGSGAKVQLFRV